MTGYFKRQTQTWRQESKQPLHSRTCLEPRAISTCETKPAGGEELTFLSDRKSPPPRVFNSAVDKCSCYSASLK